MDTCGTCHSVYINQVSVLNRLIIVKIYELYFHLDKLNCLLYTGVHIKQVSMEQGLLYSIMKNHRNKIIL